ncbi:MAG: hypothetical protein Q8R28_11300 [Dehalococcoidia bacterium]|nr:hypothetical protein [Dehalococcoidia bacterium]
MKRKKSPTPSPSPSPDSAAAMREVLVELLPQLQSELLAQTAALVDAKLEATKGAVPDQAAIVKSVVATLGPQVTADINAAVGRVQAQVTDGLAALQSAKPPALPGPANPTASTNETQPANPAAVERVVSAAKLIFTMAETFLTGMAPQVLTLMGQYQMQKGMSVFRNPEAMQLAMQQDPVGTLYFAQMRNPNPYEQAIPAAALNWLTQGMKVRQLAAGGALSSNPPTSSVPELSANSSGGPLSPTPQRFAPMLPAGSATMQSKPNADSPQKNASPSTTPAWWLRLRPVGEKPANGTQNGRAKQPQTLSDILG